MGLRLIDANKLIDVIDNLHGNKYVKRVIIDVINEQPEVNVSEICTDETETEYYDYPDREYTPEEQKRAEVFEKLCATKINEMLEPVTTLKRFNFENKDTVKINKIQMHELKE